ncbi:MAG: hypothetical protein LBU28_08845 [Spirochaetaceae bacterium]|jgi:hypothetical protein|nr:hypothetical protein [Spirochaetaceae bacterium]
MRYFLCGFDDFFLGVREDSVAAIMIYPDAVSDMIKRDEAGDVFFSLPHFFDLADKTVRHGIVLKAGQGAGELPGLEPPAEAGEEGPRQVLLVRTVEREADFAPEDICPLPKLLTAQGKVPFLKGISFAGQAMIVFIDPAVLVARMLEAEGEKEEK